jgi:peptidoglycan/xylan/chitin deacetylase (PgdA/CDA1 family)
MASTTTFLSPLKACFFWALEFGQINRLFRSLNRGKIKSLMYHSITPCGEFFANGVGQVDFARQLSHLRKHYHVVPAHSLDDPAAYRSDQINVIITFDDGFKDNRVVATEILRSNGFTAIFFVIADCLERGDVPAFLSLKVDGAMSAPAYRTVDENDVREMIGGGMVIGSHSMKHDDYTALAYQQGLEDAAEAQRHLETRIGVEVANFAFPWGRFRIGQEADLLHTYRRVFLTNHGFNSPGDRVMFRNEVSNTLHLKAAASGSLDFFRGLLGANK